MFIKKVKGRYGEHNDQEMNFNDGLNVVRRDNEWGKTTLISLIKVMFYGGNLTKKQVKIDEEHNIDDEKLTDEVKKIDFVGEILINHKNQDVMINRAKNEEHSSFNAYYLETGYKSEFSSKEFGKEMLGVSEEAFSNSALIECDNRLISNSSELVDLLVSMSTTGDTTKSYEKSYKFLRAKRAGLIKSLGKIETTKREIEEIEEKIVVRKRQKIQLLKLNKIIDQAKYQRSVRKGLYEEAFKDFTTKNLELNERANIIKNQSDEILEGLKKDYYEASLLNVTSAALKQVEQDEEITAKISTRLADLQENLPKYTKDLNDKREEQNQENSRVTVRKTPFIIAMITGVMSYVGFILKDTLGPSYELTTYIICAIAIVALCVSFKFDNMPINVNEIIDDEIAKLNKEFADLKANNVSQIILAGENFKKLIETATNIGYTGDNTKEKIKEHLMNMIDIHERYQNTNATKDTAYQHIDENIVEILKKSEKTLAFAKVNLKSSEEDYNGAVEQAMRVAAKVDDTTSEKKLKEHRLAKTKELEVHNKELAGVELAIETLNTANHNLTSKLSPEIARFASQYFGILTDSKYDTVVVEKDFKLLCKDSKTDKVHTSLELSTGTRDQLYFALRLAISDVLLDKRTPIILDDPFAFYDDKRMKNAMDLLYRISKTRQVLLFTSNSREEEYAKKTYTM